MEHGFSHGTKDSEEGKQFSSTSPATCKLIGEDK